MHLPEPSGNFELPPEGTFLGVCYRVIDQGTQDSTYKGETKRNRKVMISWELPDEKMEDGKPFSIHQTYTFSMSEKATLRKHLESWRGKKFEQTDFGPNGFSLKKLLGIGCLLTITHTAKGENTYANLTGVAKLMKDMQAPNSINEPIYFSMEDQATFDGTKAALQKMSEKLRERIGGSPEYAARTRGETQDDDYHEQTRGTKRSFELDDEIPF